MCPIRYLEQANTKQRNHSPTKSSNKRKAFNMYCVSFFISKLSLAASHFADKITNIIDPMATEPAT